MTEVKELFHKFQDLWQAGSDACLNLDCHAGQVWMKFQVKLCHPPPPNIVLLQDRDPPVSEDVLDVQKNVLLLPN